MLDGGGAAVCVCQPPGPGAEDNGAHAGALQRALWGGQCRRPSICDRQMLLGLATFQGQADDVKLAARGVQAGNALNWQYEISLEMSGTNLNVHFDDWIYKQDEDVAINRAFVTKFGVEIGSVTIVFIRGKTASTLWPLELDEWPSG